MGRLQCMKVSLELGRTLVVVTLEHQGKSNNKLNSMFEG